MAKSVETMAGIKTGPGGETSSQSGRLDAYYERALASFRRREREKDRALPDGADLQ